ncbi:ectoine/hydroxyectoine ABC transporter ATP-binding protein EhuA (plasmid) [Salipiger sp. CCB-MM3]|uniref:amino acid ABC transporter ATP-binding protein n=1 Tax=Salipiger sp. CCB-MM3 TaxID=1792508 RepID=UPI00080AABBE|nr:amino acid ABC transporter ATP-binding protein [Salipiger sp. CCB-MM3]ANT63096.1 ectoine/hydroxyectoine ABC transporter ATP-binding protein EhuA [Salipiger sp. CCB-MM3]
MTEIALEATNLIRSFGDTRALDEVYFRIPKGQVVSLVGPSGCGKSTLLRTLLWLDPPDDGFVQVGGEYLGRDRSPEGLIRRQSSREIDKIRPRIGMVYQSLNLWPHLTVEENVTRAQIRVAKRSVEEARNNARRLLDRLQISHLSARYPGEISGGQKQRVAIARALAMDPEIMLFDEPTSALDPELVGEVLNLLREFADGGMTMMVVTHELAFARDVATRLMFMDHGRIVADGDPREVISSRKNARVAEFFDRVQAFHPDFRKAN